MQVALQDLDDRLLVGFGAADELRRPVTLGTNPLTPQDMRLERFVPQNTVEHRRGQLLRAGRGGITVEEVLCFGHQGTQPLGVRVPQGIHRLVDEALVDRPEQFLHAALHLVFGIGVAAVQPVEDFHRVFFGLQIDDDEI